MRDFSPNEIPRFPARLFSLFFVDKKRGKRIKTNQQTLEISGIFRFVFIIVYGHTYATRAVEAGVPPKVLQKMLGNASLSTIMDRYVHVTDDSMSNAAALFEAGTAQISNNL